VLIDGAEEVVEVAVEESDESLHVVEHVDAVLHEVDGFASVLI